MFPVVIPHFLIWKRKKEPEILTDKILSDIHEEIRLSIIEMQKSRCTNDQISQHVMRINRAMRHKWGDTWINYE